MSAMDSDFGKTLTRNRQRLTANSARLQSYRPANVVSRKSTSAVNIAANPREVSLCVWKTRLP